MRGGEPPGGNGWARGVGAEGMQGSQESGIAAETFGTLVALAGVAPAYGR